MKKLNRTRLVLAVMFAVPTACGAPEARDAEPPAPLGSAAQPVYVPFGYGFERSGVLACDPPWGGGDCLAPDSKTLLTNFRAGTCSSWWQARFVEVWNELEPQIDALSEWELVGGQPGNSWYYWQCSGAMGTDTTAQLSWFAPNLSNGQTDDHNVTGWGEFRQYRAGTLTLYTAEFAELFGGLTDSQQRHMARSLIRRGVARQMGHGDTGSGLMTSPYRVEWIISPGVWTQAMFDQMECYSEDSGTGPDCE